MAREWLENGLRIAIDSPQTLRRMYSKIFGDISTAKNLAGILASDQGKYQGFFKAFSWKF